MISMVRIIRSRHLKTQLEFGKMLGVSRVTIGSYELGNSSPSNKMIEKLLELARQCNIECNAEDFLKKEKLSTKSVDMSVHGLI